MTAYPLRVMRSLLFLPASNPRAIAKARASDADMIFLDLEDAVKPEDKDRARDAAVAAAAEGFGDRPLALRINGGHSDWHGRDLVAVRDCRADYLILPKVDHAEVASEVHRMTAKPVLAMIETPLGVLNAAAIAAETAGLIAGTNDLSAELGIPLAASRAGLSHALQQIVLAARASGGAAFDGVFNGLEDEEGLIRQCEEGRAFGFDGKTLIHPSQIGAANRIFGPSEADVGEARRLIATASGGAERFEGKMIEGMHVAQAQAVLAKARADRA